VLSSTYEDATRRQQLKEMKEDLSKLSMVNEFAQYARLERRMNALTEDIKAECMFCTQHMSVYLYRVRTRQLHFVTAVDDNAL